MPRHGSISIELPGRGGNEKRMDSKLKRVKKEI